MAFRTLLLVFLASHELIAGENIRLRAARRKPTVVDPINAADKFERELVGMEKKSDAEMDAYWARVLAQSFAPTPPVDHPAVDPDSLTVDTRVNPVGKKSPLADRVESPCQSSKSGKREDGCKSFKSSKGSSSGYSGVSEPSRASGGGGKGGKGSKGSGIADLSAGPSNNSGGGKGSKKGRRQRRGRRLA